MSLFDTTFASGGAPLLGTVFFDETSVSIELDGRTIVTGASAYLGPERTTEEYQGEGITKRVEMEIDMLRDELGSPFKGLRRNTTSGIAIVNGVRWNIDGIDNRTETFVTLKLVRKTSKEQSTSGLRRQES